MEANSPALCVVVQASEHKAWIEGIMMRQENELLERRRQVEELEKALGATMQDLTGFLEPGLGPQHQGDTTQWPQANQGTNDEEAILGFARAQINQARSEIVAAHEQVACCMRAAEESRRDAASARHQLHAVQHEVCVYHAVTAMIMLCSR